MAGPGDPAVDKLRAYLRALKPGAQALLIAELERGLLQGTAAPGAELILSELRRSLRNGQTRSARFSDPARLFFQPIEPFLVDDGPDRKIAAGSRARRSSPCGFGSPMRWCEEAKRYSDRVERLPRATLTRQSITP